eukprot:jgi/Botrbrau1/21683/Bobra.43_1s0079.1
MLMDFDVLDNDDLLGVAEFPMSNVHEGDEMDLWLPVDPEKKHGQSEHEGGSKTAGMTDKVKRVGAGLVGKAQHAYERAPGTHSKKCRIHIKANYYKFQDQDLKEALDKSKRPRSGHNSALDILRGGVLWVYPRKADNLVHKPLLKGGLLKSTATVVVNVCGQKKKSVAAKGSSPVFSDRLEFILGEEELGRHSNAEISIEIWDFKLFNSYRGGVKIPLRDVLRQRRMKNTFTLEGVSHGDLSLELQWFGLLDA